MKNFKLSRNGSVLYWVPENEINLLFPDQILIINGQEKRRGDSHVCYPVVGKKPTTENYAGVNMPQHGNVRRAWELGSKCVCYLNESDGVNKSGEYQYSETGFSFEATDDFPWKNEAFVCVESTLNGRQIKHELIGGRGIGCENPKQMPLSEAFHPYFATFGKPFAINCSGYKVSSEGIKKGSSFYIPRVGDRVLRLKMEHGTILMSLAGGQYTSFCVWTDAIDEYICVEPVVGKPDDAYSLLSPGETLHGTCTMRFIPS